MGNFIAPWSVWLAELAALLILVTFAARSPINRDPARLLVAAAALALVLTSVVALAGGLGSIWDVRSALGKSASGFAAFGLPLFVGSATMLLASRIGASPFMASCAAIAVGLGAVVPIVFIGVGLACVTTGDCP